MFILLTCLTTLSTCELVVYDTMDGENNQLEKIMEVAGIRIYHYGWKFFQKGSDMLCVVMVVEMKTVFWFWWLTTLWMARTYRWRRPWMLVTS